MAVSLVVASFAAGCAAGTTTDDPGEPGDGGVTIVDAAHDSHVTPHDGGVDANGIGDDTSNADTGTPQASTDSGTIDTGQPVSTPDANVPDTNVPDTSVATGAVKPGQGELLITEVMYNPTTLEPDTEWFEVTNTASGPRLLTGLSLSDGSGHTETIGSAPAVAPGAYVVLARNQAAATSTAKVPAASIVYEYTALTLANGATGALTIKDGSTTVAQAPYGNFAISSTSATANSIQLKALTYSSESTAANWCLSTTTWASGSDHGSPGAALNCQ